MKMILQVCLILTIFGFGCYDFITMENCKTTASRRVKMLFMVLNFALVGFGVANFVTDYLN